MINVLSKGLRGVVSEDLGQHITSLCWEDHEDRHEVTFGLDTTELGVRNKLHTIFLSIAGFIENGYLSSVDYNDDNIVFTWKKTA